MTEESIDVKRGIMVEVSARMLCVSGTRKDSVMEDNFIRETIPKM